MKLSEYMTKGIAETERLLWSFRTERDGIVYTCAMGAALWGKFGRRILSESCLHLINELPLVNRVAKDPVNGRESHIRYIINDLHDLCNWSREQVRDWIQSIEESYETE